MDEVAEVEVSTEGAIEEVVDVAVGMAEVVVVVIMGQGQGLIHGGRSHLLVNLLNVTLRSHILTIFGEIYLRMTRDASSNYVRVQGIKVPTHPLSVKSPKIPPISMANNIPLFPPIRRHPLINRSSRPTLNQAYLLPLHPQPHLLHLLILPSWEDVENNRNYEVVIVVTGHEMHPRLLAQ